MMWKVMEYHASHRLGSQAATQVACTTTENDALVELAYWREKVAFLPFAARPLYRVVYEHPLVVQKKWESCA